ncbi:MAG: hypothetical protein ACE1Y2_04350, partial [Stenotrophomonas maltophilia]
IRHPRGGSEVLSRYAVGDFQLDLSFHVKHSLGSYAEILPYCSANTDQVNSSAQPGRSIL